MVKYCCPLHHCYNHQMLECRNASEWQHSMLCTVCVDRYLSYCSLGHPMHEELLVVFNQRYPLFGFSSPFCYASVEEN